MKIINLNNNISSNIHKKAEMSLKRYRAVFSKEEKQAFVTGVGNFLKNAHKDEKKVTITEIANKIGVTFQKIKEIIKTNSEYTDLFEKVRKNPDRKIKSNEEILKEKELIKNHLINLKKLNLKMSRKNISSELGISVDVFITRVRNDEILNNLWSEIKYESPKRFTENEKNEIYEKIKSFLLMKQQKGEKAVLKDIAEYINTDRGTLNKILKKHKDLKTLFNNNKKIKRYSKKEKEKISNYILEFLRKARQNGEKITITGIAKHFSLSENVTGEIINENTQLKYNWNLVQKYKYKTTGKTEQKEQKAQITKIIKDYIAKGKKLTLKQLAELLNLTERIVNLRINSSATAKNLWRKASKKKQYTYSNHQKDLQRKEISKIINRALNNGEKVTIKEIANELNVNRTLILRRINSDDKLKMKWEKMKYNLIT